ncbi:hypothetical protein B566_EDAN006516, partial [Ephemera danica]
MELCSSDIMGPLPLTSNGNKYILFISDEFTKFVEVYALPDIKTETIANALLDFICIYGAPLRLLTDRGANYTSKIFQQLCEKLGISRILSLPFAPTGNGSQERSHQTFAQIMSQYVNPRQPPYMLQFGRDIQLPYDVLKTPYRPSMYLDDTDYLSETIGKLQLANEIVLQHRGERLEQYKRSYDKRAREPPIKIGDLVLLQNNQPTKGTAKKLQMRWVGPYRVLEKRGNASCLIQTLEGGKPRLVHINKLRNLRYAQTERSAESEEDTSDNIRDKSEGVAHEENDIEEINNGSPAGTQEVNNNLSQGDASDLEYNSPIKRRPGRPKKNCTPKYKIIRNTPITKTRYNLRKHP